MAAKAGEKELRKKEIFLMKRDDDISDMNSGVIDADWGLDNS